MIGERVYLAARYSRRAEMYDYAVGLRNKGLIVCSSWVDHPDELPDDGPGGATDPGFYAARDFDDVSSADTLVLFCDNPDETSTKRGGRHVEFGVALALDLNVIVVGQRENIFQYLPQVVHFDKWEDAVDYLDIV